MKLPYTRYTLDNLGWRERLDVNWAPWTARVMCMMCVVCMSFTILD